MLEDTAPQAAAIDRGRAVEGVHSRLDDALPIVYLGLPTLIFLIGWIRPIFGIPAAVALIVCSWWLLRGRSGCRRSSDGDMPRPVLSIVLIVGSIWPVLGGIGHFVYANADWIVRDAVLRDLVELPWPVHYGTDQGRTLLLRAPLAFYLPSAVIGKCLGIRIADLGLLAWTIAGVTLTFWLMLRDRPGPRRAAVRLVVFVLFSGMDIIGHSISFTAPALGDHLEWWAVLFQYSSLTTQLFWVPNHALPGWITVAWLLGHRRRAPSIPVAVAMLACIPLWSPLTAIGVAPLVALAIVRQLKATRWSAWLARCLDPRALTAVAVFAILVGPYIVVGGGTIPGGVSWTGPDGGEVFAMKYVEFVVLEFGLLAILLMRRTPRDPLLVGAIVVLLILPFYHFGLANDLAMRASIGPLALLAIRLGDWLSSPSTGPRDRGARMVAGGLLLIGAVTPAMEFARAFIEPRWPMDTRSTLVEVTHGYAPHYLTSGDQPWPTLFLR